jgi:hypothetical protein
MSFYNSTSGGLVNSVVAGISNNASTAIQNIGSGQSASFAINSVLGGIVQDSTGYGLNEGQNYLLSQLGSTLGNSAQGALVNAITTQIATAGLNQAAKFISQVIPNPFLGGGGTNVTTAGLGAQAARATISIPDSIASKLEDADYGGSTYTLDDITFTLVPANTGAQTAQPPQTAPLVDINTAFSPNANFAPKALDALKGQTAYTFPAAGAVTNSFGTGDFYKPATTVTSNFAKPLW